MREEPKRRRAAELAVSGTIGVIAAIALLLSSALLPGDGGGKLSAWLFSNNGIPFLVLIFLFGAAAYPFVHRAKLRVF
jgi:hypothetical protein